MVVQLLRGVAGHLVFKQSRQHLARGILPGLAFPVAGEIIHTVAVDFTFTSGGVLAIVVAIRTFLI